MTYGILVIDDDPAIRELVREFLAGAATRLPAPGGHADIGLSQAP